MRVSLGDFVGGSFALPQNPVGMGDFVGGAFAVPQNPVGMGSLVPSAPLYPIPLNSVIAAYDGGGASYSGGLSGLGCGGSKDDCGCGCGGGMGQISLTSISAPFTQAWTDIQAAIAAGSISPLTGEDWLVIGGTAAAIWFLMKKK